MKRIEAVVVMRSENAEKNILHLEREGYVRLETNISTIKQFGPEAFCLLWREVPDSLELPPSAFCEMPPAESLRGMPCDAGFIPKH